ncbi:MAG: hypothetical protein H0X37_22845 [Herpetosiphonaceae bacterium]|nr:hypothetical protein [Herpetosiphonaceae bacterium]
MAKIEQLPTSISRTFRAAIRVGEDFYTVEETVTLPPTATDDEIAAAVALGERIYQAQRAAADTQVRMLRDQTAGSPQPIQIRDPEAPASDKQRQYMDYLVNELHWNGAQLQQFAAERKLDILTLTKREASELIDDLKGLLDLRTNAPVAKGEAEKEAEEATPALPTFVERATQRQVKALERLAEDRGIDMGAELTAAYGHSSLDQLSLDEAGQLLTEWQQRPRQLRPRIGNQRQAA